MNSNLEGRNAESVSMREERLAPFRCVSCGWIGNVHDRWTCELVTTK